MKRSFISTDFLSHAHRTEARRTTTKELFNINLQVKVFLYSYLVPLILGPAPVRAVNLREDEDEIQISWLSPSLSQIHNGSHFALYVFTNGSVETIMYLNSSSVDATTYKKGPPGTKYIIGIQTIGYYDQTSITMVNETIYLSKCEASVNSTQYP